MRKFRQLIFLFFFFINLIASAQFCQAIPSQFGDTGLISQPTAETLNSGNICVGIIGNCADNDGKTATVLPVFMTLGLGNFLEAYGSYPNILFNDNEDASGRGYSNVGLKIRVFGKRSSQFKLGLDGQIRRTVSGNVNNDGLTAKVVRAVASYNNGPFGIHANAGYITPESPKYISYEDQIIYGGGLEYQPNSRLRLLTEIGIESSKFQGLSDRAEVTAGFQYYLSPHLTFNLALAKGFSDESPNWRALFGVSSCQGIGTYQIPVARKIQPQAAQSVEDKTEAKPLKIRTLNPLMKKRQAAEPDNSSSQFEVPVGKKAEVVTLSSATKISGVDDVNSGNIQDTPAATGAPLIISSGIPLLQVAPEISGSAAASALALPANEGLIPLSQIRPARSYNVNDIVKTDKNQVVGKKIVEDIHYAAQFYSIVETPESFSVVFFHKNDKPLDVWIEGADKVNTKLSKSKAAPYEEVTLIVEKVNGKVPYFKLHLGEASEIFEFFPLRKSVRLGKIDINFKSVSGVRGAKIQDSMTGQVINSASKVLESSASVDASPPVVSTKTFQAVAHKKFILPSAVIFTFDEANLTDGGRAAITEVVESIKKEKRWYALRVDGFTDSIGSEDYNIKLGLRRAVSVASYMVTNNGIDPSIVFVKSSGENSPIASNETEEGRAMNRRAEIVLFVQKDE